MRIDLTTGTQVPFTAADKVSSSVKALQNQTIGVKGVQFISATVDAPTAAALVALTQQQLTGLAEHIGRNASAQILYAHLSYDINGNTVTNYSIGVVAKINYVPNNGGDIANAIHNSPLGYITDQFASYGYETYIIGSPPMGTFHYVQEIQTETEKWIDQKELFKVYPDEATAKAELTNRFLANIQAATQQAYNEQGINVTVISAEVINSELESRTGYNPSTMPRAIKQYRFKIGYRLTLDSDFAFQNSPIVPIVLAAIIIIAKIVAIAAVAGITAYFIVEWLKAMTTKSWSSKQTTYGWVLNPNTGQYEWKVTEEKEEEGTQPDLGGTGLIVLGFIAVVAVIMVLLGFKGQGTKK